LNGWKMNKTDSFLLGSHSLITICGKRSLGSTVRSTGSSDSIAKQRVELIKQANHGHKIKIKRIR